MCFSGNNLLEGINMDKLAEKAFADANSKEALFKSNSYFSATKIYTPNTKSLQLALDTYSNKAAQPVWQVMIQRIYKTGHSINDIANNLCLSKATVRRLINGAIKNPSNKTFNQILGFYCVVFCSPNTKANENTIVKH